MLPRTVRFQKPLSVRHNGCQCNPQWLVLRGRVMHFIIASLPRSISCIPLPPLRATLYVWCTLTCPQQWPPRPSVTINLPPLWWHNAASVVFRPVKTTPRYLVSSSLGISVNAGVSCHRQGTFRRSLYVHIVFITYILSPLNRLSTSCQKPEPAL
jgi:hypothetical protein